MVILKDYITSLFSSVIDARASSDYVSAQVAQQYKSHEILKSFAIPRMRVDTVEMNIPVALDRLNIGRTIRKSLDVGSLSLAVYETSCRSFMVSPSDIEEETATELKKQVLAPLREYVATIAKEGEVDEKQMYSVAGQISEIVYDGLYEKFRLKDMEMAPSDATESVKTTIYNSVVNTIYDSVSVMATAEELSGAKEQTISKIKLTVREDGMEWAFSKDENGNVQSSLIHE